MTVVRCPACSSEIDVDELRVGVLDIAEQLQIPIELMAGASDLYAVVCDRCRQVNIQAPCLL